MRRSFPVSVVVLEINGALCSKKPKEEECRIHFADGSALTKANLRLMQLSYSPGP